MLAAAAATSLFALSTAAATVGLIHTLVGPDHYVPLVALAKQRGLGHGRALRLTALAGLLHCLASVVLVAVLLAALASADGIALLQAWRGSVAGMLLLGLGVAMLLAARRQRAASAPVRAVRPLLLLVFALGPCEWLVPAAVTAAAEHGLAGALLVSGVFTAATVLTMVSVVALGLAGAKRLRLDPLLAGGVATAACGVLVLVGY